MASVIQRKSYNENLVDARVPTITATESPEMVTLTIEDASAEGTDRIGVVEISDVLGNARLHDGLPSGLVDTPAAVASLVEYILVVREPTHTGVLDRVKNTALLSCKSHRTKSAVHTVSGVYPALLP